MEKSSTARATESTIADDANPGYDNIAGALLTAARRHPSNGLYIAGGERGQNVSFVSYPTLLEESRRILGGIDAPAGSAIALLLERPGDFIPAFWACILGGYLPCPVAPIRNDPGRWSQHLAHVDRLLTQPLFISTGALLAELPSSVTATDVRILRDSLPSPHVHHAQSTDPAVLMLTSGSTGNAKAVELTHGNILASMAGRADRQKLSPTDLAFNWIAFDHVAALLESHMIALYVGARQLHTEPATVLSDCLSFLRLISQHRVSLAFAPNFLLAQINSAIEAATPDIANTGSLDLDLSCLRRIVTGGEANVVKTGRQFLELLAPYGLAGNVLWPAFGMTETCAASVYSDQFPERDREYEFASVGLPIDGLEIRIGDSQDQASPEGKTGELQLRGPLIFRRYRNNDEATQAAFTADGWFRSGDVGCVERGWLRLIARNKDSIIVNGVNYFSLELETRLEMLHGIEQSYVAAFPIRPQGAPTEQLVVAFATNIAFSDENRLYQLLIAIRNTTIMLWGFRPTLIIPLPKSAFPKTSLGKTQRSLMRKRLEAGELATDAAAVAALVVRQAGEHLPPDGATELAVTDVFAKILCMEPAALSATASFFDLGGTSLDILRLTRALERRFNFKTGLPMVLQNPSVRRLARHMSGGAKPTGAYDPIIPLQISGKKTPLFCVHPGNGEIFSLVNVTKYFLNDRPFYAIRPPGFNEGETFFTSMREMIDTYTNAIVDAQSHGPYAIAGYSLGCPIAFEIAKELEHRGRKVAFLGAIDGRPRYTAGDTPFNMAAGLALVIDLITKNQFDALARELRPELPTNDVCEYVLRLASPDRLSELDLDLDKFSVWSRVAHANETMLYRHVNTGTVGKMTVFRGEGYLARYYPEWSSTDNWRKELTRWKDFVLQPRYVDISGHHHAVMGPEHVAVFQGILRSEIDRAFDNMH